MPFYEIQHTYPLTRSQKHHFAQAITRLHSTTFLTPSLFVNVSFHRLQASSPRHAAAAATSTANEDVDVDDEDNTYFLAGNPVPHNHAGPNRLLAMVRTSPARTKAVFDDLAAKLEAEWDATVLGPPPGKGKDNKVEKAAKRMHFIVFYPMVAARENGVTIPDAGNESSWLRDNMPFFRAQAYDHDDDNFRDMIDEINQRPDLKKLLGE
ncbi:uncharacterized protein Z520_05542 [Fonsecaea multimorphosa CBS 102226]|uniref:Tautomerase cis-CaaD-like domain-containing protein n=1 Tax=Fonsecaea multimorphosa CBS 102226 TaxID=1442371 RepID=A0A0D2IQ54_9EURO|nr:uncharacterized protein Z520_05542 [Fonsecaea multimorphosa CBS 102226]KIX99081.1 hypothetical protein Z520_05542 [Fonsecaea multimorphosa CBS 102226]OAL25343.1 hypothetical protein AYO22_05220 [Fonsecaea multimorphosa]